MAVTIMRQEIAPSECQTHAAGNKSLRACVLTKEHESEALAFLSVRPIQTVFMASLIRENSLVSPLNRGTFYGCRGDEGRLEGIALIGHATLIEARSEAALVAFARLAQTCSLSHLIRGEGQKVEDFWRHYAQDGRAPRLVCRELLLEQRKPVEGCESVVSLRKAKLDDLEQVMRVNASLAFEESGTNPLEKDPEGFPLRSARRIEQGRVWVWVENGRLIFKADIIAETPEASYLEGIYVLPEERGKGYGLRCMSQLGRILLQRTSSLSLTVNDQIQNAQAFYQKAGYEFRSYYQTIYLQPHNG